jgi:hypothetical protein
MYLYVIHLCIDYKDVLYKIYLLLNLFVEVSTVYENYYMINFGLIMFGGIIGMQLYIVGLGYLVLMILCTFLLLGRELINEGVDDG